MQCSCNGSGSGGDAEPTKLALACNLASNAHYVVAEEQDPRVC